jgi:type I restriction enzyme S subunit
MKMRTEAEYPKLGSGSTFAEFKIFQLKELDVDIPPMDVQQSFNMFAEQVDKSKAVVQKSLDEMQLLFDSLMQQYFG